MHPNERVLATIDLLVAELKLLQASGPALRIVHRFRRPGTNCWPGEEVCAVFLVHRGRAHCLNLSLTLRLVVDYLAHQSFPQSASQIAVGMRTNPFYRNHAKNAIGGGCLCRRISRSATKVYVHRIREAFTIALREAGLNLDPEGVLVSMETDSNEIGYRLKARPEWVHIDLDD